MQIPFPIVKSSSNRKTVRYTIHLHTKVGSNPALAIVVLRFASVGFSRRIPSSCRRCRTV